MLENGFPSLPPPIRMVEPSKSVCSILQGHTPKHHRQESVKPELNQAVVCCSGYWQTEYGDYPACNYLNVIFIRCLLQWFFLA